MRIIDAGLCYWSGKIPEGTRMGVRAGAGNMKSRRCIPGSEYPEIHLRFSVDSAAPGRIAATYRISAAGQISLRVAEMLAERAERAAVSALAVAEVQHQKAY